MAKSSALPSVSLDNVQLATECGRKLGEANDLENKAGALKAEINVNIKALHHNKVKVGIYRKDGTGCATATAFIDGCVAGGIKASTAQRVYLGTFKSAVASGKEVADWNSSREKSKGGKGGKGKGKAVFTDLFIKAFNHEEGKSFEVLCQEIETRFQNDEGQIYDLFVSFLKMEGYEIK